MRDINALHPELQQKALKLAEKCKKSGIGIKFSECVRTKEEQDLLYAQGRTRPGNIVTNAKGSSYSSQHQWGIAVDFYLDMDIDGDGAKADDAFNNSTHMFEKVGAIAKSIGLGWGGDWTGLKDTPHLYLKDWGSTTAKLRQQYGKPERFMETWGGSKAEPDEEELVFKKFVMDVQRLTGSKVDGIPGNETLRNTITVSKSKNRKHPLVEVLQARLNVLGHDCGKADGIAGDKFEAAVKSYQKKVLGYRKPDGEITAQKGMWKSLLGMD